MYLYKAVIHKIPTEVIGLTSSEIVEHQNNRGDFEANFKSSAVKVDDLILAETTFVINKTYIQFKTLIDGALRVWPDVKFTEDDVRYILNLITTSPI